MNIIYANMVHILAARALYRNALYINIQCITISIVANIPKIILRVEHGSNALILRYLFIFNTLAFSIWKIVFNPRSLIKMIREIIMLRH